MTSTLRSYGSVSEENELEEAVELLPTGAGDTFIGTIDAGDSNDEHSVSSTQD